MIWRYYYWTESTILSVCGDYFYDFKAQMDLICFGVGMIFSALCVSMPVNVACR